MKALFRRRLAGAALILAVLAIPAWAEPTTPFETNGRKLSSVLLNTNIHLRSPHDNPQLAFLKARVFWQQSKIDEAIEVYDGMTKAYPELAEPFNNLGVLLALQGRYEQGLAALREAARLNPGDRVVYENLGDLHAKMALRAYSASVRLDASEPQAQDKLRRLRAIAGHIGGTLADQLAVGKSSDRRTAGQPH